MKNLFLTALFALIFAFATTSASAQNINKQPAWGPVGYETAYFYYLPDINIYYDVTDALFYFLSGGNWVSSRYLPDSYKQYDLYALFKVVINDEPKPWLNNKLHKKNYKQFQNNKTQTPIRHSTEDKYKESRKNNQSWVETKQPQQTQAAPQKQQQKQQGQRR